MEPSVRDFLLRQFESESANTRKTLERVPWDKREWRPHPKSMTMGQLAIHIVRLTGNPATILGSESRDMATQPPQALDPQSTGELLAAYDELRSASLAALAETTPEALSGPWSLLRDGRVIFTLPRVAAVSVMSFNHIIHHRAQLGVYLRLNDIPVPAVYGPSADER